MAPLDPKNWSVGINTRAVNTHCFAQYVLPSAPVYTVQLLRPFWEATQKGPSAAVNGCGGVKNVWRFVRVLKVADLVIFCPNKAEDEEIVGECQNVRTVKQKAVFGGNASVLGWGSTWNGTVSWAEIPDSNTLKMVWFWPLRLWVWTNFSLPLVLNDHHLQKGKGKLWKTCLPFLGEWLRAQRHSCGETMLSANWQEKGCTYTHHDCWGILTHSVAFTLEPLPWTWSRSHLGSEMQD